MGRTLYDELAPEQAASARRRLAGKRAHDDGLAFEHRLDDLHKLYQGAGRATVVKVPAPYRVLKMLPMGRFMGVFEDKGPPDYMGVVDGHAVAFDAKHSSDTPWAFAKLVEHQARYLDASRLQGAFAFVALSVAGRVWVVPWGALGPRWWAWCAQPGRAERGTASLSIADLDAIGHRCQGCDWLPVVAKLLGAP